MASLLAIIIWEEWLGVVDDMFCISAMPQHLTTKLDTLARHGVP